MGEANLAVAKGDRKTAINVCLEVREVSSKTLICTFACSYSTPAHMSDVAVSIN